MMPHRWEVRPCDRRDVAGIRRLSEINFHTHHHLDWQRLDDYLFQDFGRVWVCVEQNQIIAALGLSEMMQGTCWSCASWLPVTTINHATRFSICLSR
ncbi:MAG UNVERIFIED_CONTAM: hypothetical protein LVT10_26690 [Anaerolineae bacterium]|jgi:hypothetical protein